MHGKRVLVTGGTGYIGSSLVEKLIKDRDIEVILLVRDISKARAIFTDLVLYVEYGSVDEMQTQFKLLKPQIIVHLAAYSSSSDKSKDIEKMIESNITFTANLLQALPCEEIELFINTSSFSEYHNNSKTLSPTYFYSATKSAARLLIEYYAKRDGFNFINAVLYTVYGKKGSAKKIIDYAMDSLDSKEPVAMSEGRQKLDFTHIEDVVNFYSSLIQKSASLENSQIDYHIGSGRAYTIRELVKKLEELTEKKANIEWGVYKSRKVDTQKAQADISSAKKELHYRVEFPIDKGLMKYVRGNYKALFL